MAKQLGALVSLTEVRTLGPDFLYLDYSQPIGQNPIRGQIILSEGSNI